VKFGSKIESQSGKAKGGKTTSDGVTSVDANGVNEVGSNRLTTYPSRLSLHVQSYSRNETTSCDGEIVTTSDDSPPWTVVQQKRKTHRFGRVRGLKPQGDVEAGLSLCQY
jgi:hypothetical protein